MPEIRLTRRERTLGSLLGGALGDALGAPVEFDRWDQIQRTRGPGGIQQLEPSEWGLGAITDDTQMTLFTAEGLIRAYNDGWRGAADEATAAVHGALRRWLYTQDDRVFRGRHGIQSGWLIEQRSLHDQRAPGATCLTALYRDEGPIARNDSKGCGGVMRSAPCGLVRAQDPYTLGVVTARITHGHPAGWQAAGLFAAVISDIAFGTPLDVALRSVRRKRRAELHPDMGAALERLDEALQHDARGAAAVAHIGEGWVAEEALAIALYAALTTDNVTDALRVAVNHSGDSDSTGAMTGNLVGAMYGATGLPERWLRQLELVDVISLVAEQLVEVAERGEADEERFPPSRSVC